VNLNVAFKPDVVVVDAIVALGGYRGPVSGMPIRLDTLAFGRNPVAMDCLVARIMGIKPTTVEYLVEAKRRGLGTSEYKTEGPVPWGFRPKFRVPPLRLRNLYGMFRISK
jgi:uncharacterized protein (DUF362 family)